MCSRLLLLSYLLSLAHSYVWLFVVASNHNSPLAVAAGDVVVCCLHSTTNEFVGQSK